LELWYPLLRLREAGIEAKLVGINVEETFYGRHGFPARAEMAISLINARDFDGVNHSRWFLLLIICVVSL